MLEREERKPLQQKINVCQLHNMWMDGGPESRCVGAENCTLQLNI